MSLDPDGRIANYNTACERASGYENVEDVRHEYFWDVFISPGERDRVRDDDFLHAGIETIRVTGPRLDREPAGVVDSVRRHLARRAGIK